MSFRKYLLVLAVLILPIGAAAEGLKHAIKVTDRASFSHALKSMGYQAKGGISKSDTDANNPSGDDDGNGRNKSFPHFTSSFKYKGNTYPYTMVGYSPGSGKSTTVRSVIIPLRMNFTFFDTGDLSFDPMPAVKNIVNSPLYVEAPFPNGVGQFGDMLQRATFWNKMDRDRKWHVKMGKPRVLDPVDILVEPDVAELFDLGGGAFIGNVRFGYMDGIIHTILQYIDIQPDELPIFVTDNVIADALGYHDAFAVGKKDNSNVLQTLIYTSWLDPAIVRDIIADVSTFNHELGEWLNDPYVNNIVPTWQYPNIDLCSDNPFLEVGDPEGNGPNFEDFPTFPITLNGTAYHLQDLVMLPWFAGEVPSTAQNGWYDFPNTKLITKPQVPCL